MTSNHLSKVINQQAEFMQISPRQFNIICTGTGGAFGLVWIQSDEFINPYLNFSFKDNFVTLDSQLICLSPRA